MKRLLLGLAFLLLCTIPALAQANTPRRYDINLNLSWSRQAGDDRAGGDISFAFHATKQVAIVAEASIHTPVLFGGQDLSTYRFGPRYSSRRGNRITTFAHVLAGGARLTRTHSLFFTPTSATTTSSHVDGFSFAAGGGVDVGIRPWFAFRIAQVDYTFLHLPAVNSSGMSVGMGIVFRFGKLE